MSQNIRGISEGVEESDGQLILRERSELVRVLGSGDHEYNQAFGPRAAPPPARASRRARAACAGTGLAPAPCQCLRGCGPASARARRAA